MAYQELYVEQSPSIYMERLNEAISQYQPSKIDTFLGYADQAYMYSPAAFAIEYFAQFQNETLIEEKDWNNQHDLWGDGTLSWHEDLTEGQAIVENRVKEREKELSVFLKNTDPWSPVALAGSLGMNLGSWENWIPIASWMGHFNKIKNIAPKVDFIGSIDGLIPVKEGIAKVPLTTAQTFGLRVADATISESIFQTTKNMFNSGRGKETDYLQSAVEVALATASGGVLASFSFAKKLKDIPLEKHFENMSFRLTELRDGIHARYFDKGRYSEPELNRESVLDELKTRSSQLDEDVRLTSDASKDRVKAYGQSLINDSKKFGAKVLETLRCVKLNG